MTCICLIYSYLAVHVTPGNELSTYYTARMFNFAIKTGRRPHAHDTIWVSATTLYSMLRATGWKAKWPQDDMQLILISWGLLVLKKPSLFLSNCPYTLIVLSARCRAEYSSLLSYTIQFDCFKHFFKALSKAQKWHWLYTLYECKWHFALIGTHTMALYMKVNYVHFMLHYEISGCSTFQDSRNALIWGNLPLITSLAQGGCL